MPRDSNGTYTLPSGNPVVTGTVIAAGWANPTMGDVANEMTNSLDRQGRGGMLAPFKFLDGTAGSPGMTWTSEPTMGFFRAGASDMEATVAGVPRQRWVGTGTDVWDPAANAGAGAWFSLVNASGLNIPLLNAENEFTVGQKVINAAPSWLLLDAPVPTKGARFAYNLGTPNSIDLSLYDGVAWNPKLTLGTAINYYDNGTHVWRAAGGVSNYGKIESSGGNGVWSFGPGTYVATALATFSAGVALAAPGNVELGVFANGGWANPRVGFIAYDNGVSDGYVGMDYAFSNGITAFRFKRNGTEIFRYSETGVEVISGGLLSARSPNNTLGVSISHSASGGVYETSATSSGHQFFVDAARVAQVQASGISIYNGFSLDMFSAGNGAQSRLFQAQSTTSVNSFRVGDQGAILHHLSSSYQGGGITVSSSAAPPTGGRGDIYLQVV